MTVNSNCKRVLIISPDSMFEDMARMLAESRSFITTSATTITNGLQLDEQFDLIIVSDCPRDNQNLSDELSELALKFRGLIRLMVCLCSVGQNLKYPDGIAVIKLEPGCSSISELLFGEDIPEAAA